MQSSTAVMCRAMVMLACLVVIPLVALFGNSLPDVVTDLVERVRGKWAFAVDSLDSAPQFSTADATARPTMPPPLSDGSRVCLPSGDPSSRWPGNAAATPADPATNSKPVPFATAADAAVPVGYNAPIGVPMGNNASAGGAFVEIQERLRGLGATYYRLESWGAEQRLFRFQCAMTLGGSPNLTQHFEATDIDPLRAMGKVLADVEAWKTRR
jgi:hypothetical protein